MEDLCGTIVHLDRKGHMELAKGPAKQLVDRRIQIHDLRCFGQLRLRNLERVQFAHFVFTPLLIPE
jgi:hypothetical protein